jgi:hypothetical protein
LRTNSEKEEDETCGRIESSRSDVAWGPELHYRSHQEGNGRDKVEISELHAYKLAMQRREGNHGG